MGGARKVCLREDDRRWRVFRLRGDVSMACRWTGVLRMFLDDAPLILLLSHLPDACARKCLRDGDVHHLLHRGLMDADGNWGACHHPRGDGSWGACLRPLCGGGSSSCPLPTAW